VNNASIFTAVQWNPDGSVLIPAPYCAGFTPDGRQAAPRYDRNSGSFGVASPMVVETLPKHHLADDAKASCGRPILSAGVWRLGEVTIGHAASLARCRDRNNLQ